MVLEEERILSRRWWVVFSMVNSTAMIGYPREVPTFVSGNTEQ
jgi:hypothetical protein